MKKDDSGIQYTSQQLFSLTILRVLIGWHFLYEGLVKLWSEPAWTSKAYLMGSVGPAAPLFKTIAASQLLLNITDKLNIWGLVLIGLSLFTGLFCRYFKIFGIFLLLLYYAAYPPFASLGAKFPAEGSYWIVNKNLIEMAALFVLFLFPTSQITGLDYFLLRSRKGELPV